MAIAAVPALLPDSAAAAGLPMRVNDTRDLPDSNLGDGICRAGFSGDTGCTLRAAIQEANNSFGSDTIIVDPGVYELEIPTFADDLDSTGDFDIRGSLTILGSTDPEQTRPSSTAASRSRPTPRPSGWTGSSRSTRARATSHSRT